MAKQPNVLFICSDQWGARVANGLPRDEGPRKPNLDALAVSGTTFTGNYCTFPLCTPNTTVADINDDFRNADAYLRGEFLPPLPANHDSPVPAGLDHRERAAPEEVVALRGTTRAGTPASREAATPKTVAR